MGIFEPYRAIGYITNSVPFSVQRLGTETFVTVSVGKAFQVYNVRSLLDVLLFLTNFAVISSHYGFSFHLIIGLIVVLYCFFLLQCAKLNLVLVGMWVLFCFNVWFSFSFHLGVCPFCCLLLIFVADWVVFRIFLVWSVVLLIHMMLDFKALNCQRRFELLPRIVSTRLLLMGLILQFSSVPTRFAHWECILFRSESSWKKMINCTCSIHHFLVCLECMMSY